MAGLADPTTHRVKGIRLQVARAALRKPSQAPSFSASPAQNCKKPTAGWESGESYSSISNALKVPECRSTGEGLELGKEKKWPWEKGRDGSHSEESPGWVLVRGFL